MKIFYAILFSFFISSLHAEINVAVAANMRETADLLVAEFQKTNDVKINIISASSGELYHQIVNGAPFQVFISADTDYPNKLYKEQLTIGEPYVYAYGLLVVAGQSIKIKSLTDIGGDNVSYIAIANPALAPYGKVAVEVLKKQNLLDSIKNKVVFGNSINEVNQLLLSNAVDIAFTAKSTVIFHKSLKYYEVSTHLYDPIPQAAVLLKSENDAELFFNFIKSDVAKNILSNSGYLIK
ncbi:MAG: molybdate ABC transporter substrate-binding protein [Alphaproteobacteria bacterium]|jgi:molybdate transport system substrate-binding protein|nr:molybdate ABC transporter substrate-binding protein [Alphaproteobacteria bacterium]